MDTELTWGSNRIDKIGAVERQRYEIPKVGIELGTRHGKHLRNAGGMRTVWPRQRRMKTRYVRMGTEKTCSKCAVRTRQFLSTYISGT
jgi:hypothetical protein